MIKGLEFNERGHRRVILREQIGSCFKHLWEETANQSRLSKLLPSTLFYRICMKLFVREGALGRAKWNEMVVEEGERAKAALEIQTFKNDPATMKRLGNAVLDGKVDKFVKTELTRISKQMQAQNRRAAVDGR